MSPFLVHCLRLIVLCSALLSWVSPAFADTVALLQPPTPSPGVTEVLARLHGELLSVGFEVVLAERPEGREPGATNAEAWQRTLATDTDIDAVVDVVGQVPPFAVDVWIADGEHSFHEVVRVALEPNAEGTPKRLAIRTSEVLRAYILKKHLAKRERPRDVKRERPQDVPVPKTQGPVPSELPGTANQPPPRLGLELGAAALASLDGVGPAILPIARFDWAVRSEFLVQTTLAGFGTRPTIATTSGNARVAMQYALLGGCYRLSTARWLKPFLALSGGALRTSVEGRADPPRQGHSVATWSFLLDASLGIAFELSRHYSLSLAAHAELAQPYVAIHFGDQTVASAGRPNLLMTLTLGAWP